MFKKLASLSILLVVPAWAQAQERPLSPPARAPVPLSAADQERARAEELSKKKEKVDDSTTQIKAPAKISGRHISANNPVLDVYINEAAAVYGLDPCLIVSVMRAESGFNKNAISPKGASGLMQLMPATAIRFGVRNIFDPRENILGGAKYLRWLLDRFQGDVRLVLAGYNAGEGAVEFYGHRIPPFLETQNYVRTIYARYRGIHTASLPETITAAAPEAPAAEKEKIPTYNQIIIFTSSSGDGPTIKIKNDPQK